jgi:hypothetical protein
VGERGCGRERVWERGCGREREGEKEGVGERGYADTIDSGSQFMRCHVPPDYCAGWPILLCGISSVVHNDRITLNSVE